MVKLQFDSKYALEYEILLDKNYTIDTAKEFLLAQGYKVKAYQETLREKWSINDCPEIAIDTLPGIPTYVELECINENKIKKICKLLDFNFNDAKYGSYVNQYIDYYNINIDDGNYPELTFKNIDKELNPIQKSQKDFLIKLKKKS